jgi:L-cysteine desulfidase
MNKVKVQINNNVGQNVNVDVIVKIGRNFGHSVIKNRYDNVELVEANGKNLYIANHKKNETEENNYRILFKNLKIDNLTSYVCKMPVYIKNIIIESIKTNSKLSDIGIKNPIGLGLGYLLNKMSHQRQEIASFIKAKTAAAVDVRMSGQPIKVIAVAQSGNMGLTATLPIVAYAEKKGINEQLLIESVALSYLITIYLSYNSGYTSGICGCSTKCGLGASAGIAYYMSKRNVSFTKKCMQLFIGNLPGVICDGAKSGCSQKAATAADAAFQSSLLALSNQKPFYFKGIVGKSIEESIKNVCRIIESTSSLDEEIVNLIQENEYS